MVCIGPHLLALLFLLFLFVFRGGGVGFRGGFVGSGAEDGVGVYTFEDVDVPDFNIGVKRPDGGHVASSGSVVFGAGVGVVIYPFYAEGLGGEHYVVVDVEVVFGGFIDVYFEVGDVVFYLGRDNKIVCWEDLEFFSFII
jgi:hypothetical protein